MGLALPDILRADLCLLKKQVPVDTSAAVYPLPPDFLLSSYIT